MKFNYFSFISLLLLSVLKINAGVISDYIYNQRNAVGSLFGNKKNISYGGSISTTLDVYANGNNSQNLKPVVIFVHGGAWISGNKLEYQMIGNILSNNGYVAVLPNYLLSPMGSMDDMVNDVYQCVLWTYKNISQYGGDNSRIILTGHSAGAHLSMLTVIKATLNLENKGRQLQPLPKLEKLVLFNGPYDFNDYDMTSKLMGQYMNGGYYEQYLKVLFSSKYISPTNILKSYQANAITDLGVPQINFYAADSDQLVPQSSAVNMMAQLRRVSPNTKINYIFNQGNGYDHFTLIVGCQMGSSKLQNIIS
ncbi:hypothetical protein PIROE2DRAFT_11546 [Piromyces sp. E2]|nr:hypothetical protein PIROE2DRAFT_11546 [Piromyces sp. E2]|eukprot:OUM62230.1 hypothetical protein PIROE2DRAFT_11546 [Piromyces sp. E2]